MLRAAGAKVLVDIDHFLAGQTVIGQMDPLQSSASRHVLVITADYVASDYCRHEMEQAIKSDPGFSKAKCCRFYRTVRRRLPNWRALAA